MKRLTFILLFFGFAATAVAQKIDAAMYKNIKLKPAVSKTFLSDNEKLKLIPVTATKASSITKKVTVGIVASTDPSVTLSALNAFIVTSEYMRLNGNGMLIFSVTAPEKSYYTFEINLNTSANKEFVLNCKENGNKEEKKLQAEVNKLQFTLMLDKGDNSIVLSAKPGGDTWDFVNAQVAKAN